MANQLWADGITQEKLSAVARALQDQIGRLGRAEQQVKKTAEIQVLSESIAPWQGDRNAKTHISQKSFQATLLLWLTQTVNVLGLVKEVAWQQKFFSCFFNVMKPAHTFLQRVASMNSELGYPMSVLINPANLLCWCEASSADKQVFQMVPVDFSWGSGAQWATFFDKLWAHHKDFRIESIKLCFKKPGFGKASLSDNFKALAPSLHKNFSESSVDLSFEDGCDSFIPDGSILFDFKEAVASANTVEGQCPGYMQDSKLLDASGVDEAVGAGCLLTGPGPASMFSFTEGNLKAHDADSPCPKLFG